MTLIDGYQCTTAFHVARAKAAQQRGISCLRITCTVCSLPIGIPCEPEPDGVVTTGVAIEIRAAELAAGYRIIGGLTRPVSSAEVQGWSEYTDWINPEHVNEWLAGWLGHVIYATPMGLFTSTAVDEGKSR